MLKFMSNILSKVKSSIELSRWQLNLDYSLILTLFGIIAALGFSLNNANLSLILLAIISNLFANFGTFAINDIADHIDDLQDPKKKQRNPISAGRLSIKEGWIVYIFFTLISIISAFAIYNQTKRIETVILSIIVNLLGFLYSEKPIRLKDVPILDVLSHGLFLGGLQVLLGFFSFSKFVSIQAQPLLLIAGAFTFISFYGQFTNQIKDYQVDKLTNVKSTTQKFGLEIAKFLKFGSLAIAVGLILPLFVTNKIQLDQVFYLSIFAVIAICYPIFRALIYKSKKIFQDDLNRAILFAIICYLLSVITNSIEIAIAIEICVIILVLFVNIKRRN